MPEVKIYTVNDLRVWLTNNHPAKGLSERVIAPTRAWAIIHNPYVKEKDAIVAAIFEDGELAAYTASFPDMLDGGCYLRGWRVGCLYRFVSGYAGWEARMVGIDLILLSQVYR